jgi:uncharacterized protein
MARDISSVIAKVVGPCNLNCSYCYVYNHADQSHRERPATIGKDTWTSLLIRMRDYCDARSGHSMSLVLHGGEPTLIGLRRFEAMIEEARTTLGRSLRRCAMQTNATRLDRAWAEAIVRLDINVGVSLDGPAPIHDRVRVDHAGRGSHAAVLRGIEHLRQAGMEPQILCAVQPGADGLAVYRHLRELGIRWMNFLLPDVSHDSRMAHYPGCDPTPVADYLLPIFDAWWQEDNPDIRVSVFWELISALLGGAPASDCFGNPALGYLIVESDGEIETMDALRVCQHRMGSSGLNVRSSDFDALEAGSPWVHQVTCVGLPTPTTCLECRYKRVCGGGSLPHRYSEARAFDNPSVWCGDIQILLDRMMGAIHASQNH